MSNYNLELDEQSERRLMAILMIKEDIIEQINNYVKSEDAEWAIIELLLEQFKSIVSKEFNFYKSINS